jgi:adenine/guanine phosphoribosyltransferase-like PRPP-binding protein
MPRKKIQPEYNHAVYMEELIIPENLRKTINAVVKVLKGKNYDALAFTGQSGSLLAGPLAVRLNKPLIMVRKHSMPKPHSSREVEGLINARSYIIVDDIVSSGDTVRRIRAKIRDWAPEAEFVGVVQSFYALNNDSGPEFLTDKSGYRLKPHPKEN